MPGGGGGQSGGPEGPGGLGGGFGGGGGGPADDPSMSMGRGGTGMSNPGQDYGALSDSFGAEIDALNENSSNAQAKTFRGVVIAFATILGGLAMGVPGALLAGTLTAKGLSAARAQALVAAVQSGQMSPEQAAQQGASEVVYGHPDGGPAGNPGSESQVNSSASGKSTSELATQKSTDPKDPTFWEQFVSEWQTAKENIRLNDEFKKTVLSPAFDTYQQRLAGLSQEKTFQPINVKMGDFETSFMPKRAISNAGNILSSEMAEADVMQPKSAEMSYLDRLQGVATTEQGWATQKDIAKISKKQPNDKGSTTDAITDWLGIAKGGSDLIDSIW